MQQGGGSHSHYGGQPPPADAADAAAAAAQHHQHSSMVVEEASPISSRPPAPGSLDEIMPLSGGDVDVLAAAAEETERGGGGGEGTSGAGGGSGNRWPRQETLALLKIRSEMDASFRDATLKGPLWEDVSSKMGELGYRRSAKKCKEKFENVHKYYKRTKEGRAGRQDGKNYKFFSELEALHNITATTAAAMSTGPSLFPPPAVAMATAPPPSAVTTGLAAVPPVISFSNPFPISSIRIPPPAPGQPHLFAPASAPGVIIGSVAPATTSTAPMGINFLSNSSSSSPESEEDDDDDDEEEVEGQPSTTGSSRKRKRGPGESGSGVSRRKMMEFFEGLMKQVMQKQEEMQKRFFEVIEKREQDRMIREEAWRRQEMARLTREHEITAQERAASASRDAAIVSFLQKITGQTIQLPTLPTTVASAPTAASPVPPSAAAAPKSQAQPVHVSPSPQPQAAPPPTYQQPLQPSPQQQQRRQNIDVIMHPQPVSTEVIMAIPEQQVPPSQEIITGSRSSEPPSSSRWPKPEVLALIKLRSGLESRYQEAGPKGPLWEEISNGMARMGYKRSAKRCKEKWENINKYFKKVKESKKKRPEDAKTCPYFHELDALYQKKILGGYGGFRAEPSPSTAKSDAAPAAQAAPAVTQEQHQQVQTAESEHKNGGGSSGAQESIIGGGNGGENKKPEDIVKELIGQGQQLNQQLEQQQLRVNNSPSNDKGTEEDESDNLDDQEDNEEDYDEEDDDEELEEERKMAYKIEFQRQNSATPNGGGNGTPSVLAMVQ